MWYIPHESLYEKRDKETPEHHATRVEAAEQKFHKDHEACCKEWASFSLGEFEDKPPVNKNNKPRKTNLVQCWFPGMHINVGGGSDDPLKAQEGDLEGMFLRHLFSCHLLSIDVNDHF
jgi:hypothetical protein